jgi:hypothetical protein
MKNNGVFIFVYLIIAFFSSQASFAVSLGGEDYTLVKYRNSSRNAYFFKFRDAFLREMNSCNSNCADFIKKITEDENSPYQRCKHGVFKKSCGIINAAIEKKNKGIVDDTANNEEVQADLKDKRSSRTCKAARDAIQGENESLLKGIGVCGNQQHIKGNKCNLGSSLGFFND